MSTEIRNPDCTNCALSDGCDFPCEMYLPQHKYNSGGLMVIGDYPAAPDGTIELEPLRESRFDLFWQIAIDVVKVDVKKIYPTYTAKCKPQYGQKPSEVQYLTCASTYLKQEIQAVRPKAILLLGAAPMAAFGITGTTTSKEITIGKGDNKFTTTLVATQSPGYYHYHSNELKKFALDINKAWTIVTGITADTKSPTKVTMCITIEQVEEVVGYILQTKQCTFDFESTKLTDMGVYDPNFKATLLAISFQHGSAYTIPLFHFDSPFTQEEVMHILRLFSDKVWGNPDIHKINQNIKFDMHVAARYGFSIFRGRVDCTMIMHSLYDDLTKHGIKEWLPTVFPQFLGWELEVKGQGWNEIPLATLSNYAGVDADGALRGYTWLTKKLLEDQRVYNLYRNLYAFALRPLFNMELRGMLISREKILTYEARALELIAEQQAKMNKYIQVHSFCKAEALRVNEAKMVELRARKAKAKGKNYDKVILAMNNIKSGKVTLYKGINFGSPDQLCDLLYSKEGFGFKVPYDRKSRGNKEATGSEIVKNLKDKSGFIDDLLVLRSLQTTYSKYLKGIRLQMDENDCVHTTYNQANVKTGRLSSGGKNSGPNLQNIVTHIKIKHPFVEELTILPKKAFIVPDGYVLLNGDFSQAELRMIAELANETAMIEAYNAGKDVHILTACAISKLTEEQFLLLPKTEQKELRQKAKSANFGLIYMQSAEGFQAYAKNVYGVDMTLKEAEYIKDTFFDTYPKIAEYHAIYIAKGKKFGCVRTLFGRKAHYPDINLQDGFLKGNAERELVNMPVQGSNGENTVLALALLEYRLPSCVFLSNTVHDNIMVLAPYKIAKYAMKVIVDTCENTPQLRFFGKEMTKLKMKAEVEISITSWKDLVPYSDEVWEQEFGLL